MSTLTNLTDAAVWENDDDDDDIYVEDVDFSNYVPTAYQPGWDWTYYIIIICLAINSLLPFMLCWAHRRKRFATELETRALVPSDFGVEMKKTSEQDDDDKSIGGMSVASSAVSIVSSVLDQRVHKGLFHRQQNRKRRGRRVISPKNVNAKETGDNKNAGGQSMGDANSYLGSLDDVSVNDAVDAPGKITGNNAGALNHHDREMSLGERLVDCSTWDKEMKKIVSLWIPYSISGATEGFAQIVNFGIISHFIGLREANAYVTVVILTEFTDVFTYGFIEAVGVLGPQADGARNDLLVGRYMQLSLIFYTLCNIPGLLIWSFYTEPAVIWLGFDEETARLAQGYAYPLLAMGFFEGAGEVLDAFLEFTDHEKFAMFMDLFANAVETCAVIVMATMGIKDLVLVGIIQALASFLIMISIISVVLYLGWLDDYWEGIALTWGLNDKRAVKNMITTAIPLGLSYMLTYGEWEVMTLFAAHMGPAEVAAWGVLGFLWDTFEYIVEGLADAVEVRVGFRMGAGEMTEAKASAYKGMYLAIVISVYGTAILFLMSGHLPEWLTPDPTLQHMIFEALPLIGFGQILMSVGMVCWNILGAQGRVRLATVVEFVTSWILVIPMAAILVFVYDYNLMGMVGPLVLGYTLGCVAIIYILFTSDWTKLSDKVVEQNGGNMNYDEYDWDDLPLKIQEAATVLGYTGQMWDADAEPASSNKDWEELTLEEQEAARKLGFNRRKWDSDQSGVTEEENRSSSTGYDDYDWDELPLAIQEAAKVLGYTKRMWDTDKEPASSNKDWVELKSEEQEAALKLGYDQIKWDGDDQSDDSANGNSKSISKSPVTNSASRSPVPTASSLYDDMDWNELPAGVQKAATALGYTKVMWDGSKEPRTCDKDWKELTMDEKIAARKLGYDQKSWDGDGKSTNHSAEKPVTKALSDPTPEPVSHPYQGIDWGELPHNVQAAAKTLGYTGRMWETDSTPLVFHKNWKDLISEQQSAAKELGYDEAKWDSDAEKRGPPKYDDLTWRKLPSEVQEAAQVLGYTPKMWNNDKEPPTRFKRWNELTPDERSAANVLYLNEEKWSETPLPNYDDLSWSKLPPQVKEAATLLGYTGKMWNNDKEPATSDLDYDELTQAQKEAALTLGYDKKKWDS
ncbi:unnamed protein product [Cylindrotheca closterium]|uniref:Uncharacterized protein n=1 Tax=Cylindrotheca closterium TaxID=2856 RepID=A0AAD2JGY9_9STRA|nr:unnamed protein product [Cylindrotheca closterium]